MNAVLKRAGRNGFAFSSVFCNMRNRIPPPDVTFKVASWKWRLFLYTKTVAP
jgi:hypothetical protein